MDIQVVEIEKINPALYNPRKNLKPGDPDYEKLKKSILEFDMVEPLVVNKRTGNLVGGHQRLKILKELGRKEVEVSVVDMDEVREKALNLALNKIQGEWDFPMLKDLLLELDTGAFDIEITGFDLKEIEDLMTQFHVPEEGLTDDDAIPEKVETICKTGDLWQLGSHRLLCGDATKREDVERLMGGEKADMVFTDPPYGEGYNYRGSSFRDDPDNYWKWLPKAFNCQDKFLSEGSSVYIKHSSRQIPAMIAFLGGRYDVRNVIIWISNSQAHPHDNYDSYYEPIYYCSLGLPKTFNKRAELREKPKDYWSGEGKEFIGLLVNVWYDIAKQQAGCLMPEGGKIGNVKLHPTSMPVRLAERAIKVSSNESETILDLFGGSGSTMIACEKLGRRCFMMEIDEHYCDVIIQRWQDFTGKQAVKIE